ncbi:MAG TPA: ferrous iron transport protein A [Anaerolineaceae bacterium]|nr:ferrous iron transport protein A [Anaerolineaceae bacterium]
MNFHNVGANFPFLIGNHNPRQTSIPISGPIGLDRVAPGLTAVLQDMSGLDAGQQAHLRAYGLAPGRELRVLQHAPETVVQIEFTELAFEKEIARKIFVIVQ